MENKTAYLWEHLSPEVREAHEKIGWGGRMGFGERPAVVVIDMSLAWTDPQSPLGCDMSVTIENINKVLAVAREAKPEIPIIFTVMLYDPNLKDLSRMVAKKRPKPGGEFRFPGNRWVEIDPRLNKRAEEYLMVKKHASCFLFTNFTEMLIDSKIDTLIITGCSTSGCVNATATDSCGHGFHTIVVEEAAGDRDPVAAVHALLNIDAKFGDVVKVDETVQYLSRFRR